MNTADAICVLEAALLCAGKPLSIRQLHTLFDGTIAVDTLPPMLARLEQHWSGRGLELVQVASGWRFQSRASTLPFLQRLHEEKAPKYGHATLEILAIIAYYQPCTRGDIEEIRGVSVNSQSLRTLGDRGWIETLGARDTVGRPALYGTTRQFLDDLGLSTLSALPALERTTEAQYTLNFSEENISANQNNASGSLVAPVPSAPKLFTGS